MIEYVAILKAIAVEIHKRPTDTQPWIVYSGFICYIRKATSRPLDSKHKPLLSYAKVYAAVYRWH